MTFEEWLAEEAEEYLDRRFGPASRCYTSTIDTTPDIADDHFPWTDHDRGSEKTEVVKTAVLLGESPTKPVLRKIVEQGVFEDRNRADRMLVTRLAKKHPEILQNRNNPSGQGMLEPTRMGVSLIRSVYDCEQLPWVGAHLPSKGDTDELPSDRYRAVFGRERGIYTDKQLALAVMFLADHRATLTMEARDGSTVGKRITGKGLQLVKAEDQRFASVDTVNRERAKFETTMDWIQREYDVVTFVTFTLPRECADSPLHSYEVLTEAFHSFHDRCRTDPVDQERPSRPGERPAYLWVTEPQNDGWAHRHAIYPGRSRLMNADDLRQDWGELVATPPGVTPQVNLRSVHIGEDFDAVRDYFRNPFRGLLELAGMSETEMRELATRLTDGEAVDRDRYLATLTTLWPEERRLWGASEDLQRSAFDESDAA